MTTTKVNGKMAEFRYHEWTCPKDSEKYIFETYIDGNKWKRRYKATIKNYEIVEEKWSDWSVWFEDELEAAE
jgi:hypothetical protein